MDKNYYCLYWTDKDGGTCVMRGYKEDLLPWKEQYEQEGLKCSLRPF